MGSYKHALLGAMSLLLAVNLFAVTARIYVRGVLVKAFGWDDVFVILSYVSFSPNYESISSALESWY